jgi:hypothetical protein
MVRGGGWSYGSSRPLEPGELITFQGLPNDFRLLQHGHLALFDGEAAECAVEGCGKTFATAEHARVHQTRAHAEARKVTPPAA